MRTLTVFAGLMVCLVLTGTVASQISGKAAPPPLINDVDARPPRPRGEQPPRFTIAVAGELAILLDTTTGETWRVTPTMGAWQPIAGGPAEKRDRRPPTDDFGRRRRPPADDDDTPPGGKPEDRDTERKPPGGGQ